MDLRNDVDDDDDDLLKTRNILSISLLCRNIRPNLHI